MSDLSIELATDPLTRGYSGMTDAAVVDSLYTKNRPGPVPAKDVRRYLLLAGKWPMIVDTAAQDGTATTRVACINIIDSLANFDDFDLEDSGVLAVVTAGLDALVTATLIDEAHKTAILAMGNNRQSRAQELNLGRVLPGHVAAARA